MKRKMNSKRSGTFVRLKNCRKKDGSHWMMGQSQITLTMLIYSRRKRRKSQKLEKPEKPKKPPMIKKMLILLQKDHSQLGPFSSQSSLLNYAKKANPRKNASQFAQKCGRIFLKRKKLRTSKRTKNSKKSSNSRRMSLQKKATTLSKTEQSLLTP